jgi:hypothetical protein
MDPLLREPSLDPKWNKPLDVVAERRDGLDVKMIKVTVQDRVESVGPSQKEHLGDTRTYERRERHRHQVGLRVRTA